MLLLSSSNYINGILIKFRDAIIKASLHLLNFLRRLPIIIKINVLFLRLTCKEMHKEFGLRYFLSSILNFMNNFYFIIALLVNFNNLSNYKLELLFNSFICNFKNQFVAVCLTGAIRVAIMSYYFFNILISCDHFKYVLCSFKINFSQLKSLVQLNINWPNIIIF